MSASPKPTLAQAQRKSIKSALRTLLTTSVDGRSADLVTVRFSNNSLDKVAKCFERFTWPVTDNTMTTIFEFDVSGPIRM